MLLLHCIQFKNVKLHGSDWDIYKLCVRAGFVHHVRMWTDDSLLVFNIKILSFYHMKGETYVLTPSFMNSILSMYLSQDKFLTVSCVTY